MSPDQTKHLQLYLSGDRPEDAVQSIQETIISEAKESLEGIKDPEALLQERKTLREQLSTQKARLKKMEATLKKNNKSHEVNVKKWDKFVVEVCELLEKHDIDLPDGIPTIHTHGKTYAEKLSNSRADIATFSGVRLIQKRDDGILDNDKIKLFEVQARSVILEEIIARKHKAHKELFSGDAE